MNASGSCADTRTISTEPVSDGRLSGAPGESEHTPPRPDATTATTAKVRTELACDLLICPAWQPSALRTCGGAAKLEE